MSPVLNCTDYVTCRIKYEEHITLTVKLRKQFICTDQKKFSSNKSTFLISFFIKEQNTFVKQHSIRQKNGQEYAM